MYAATLHLMAVDYLPIDNPILLNLVTGAAATARGPTTTGERAVGMTAPSARPRSRTSRHHSSPFRPTPGGETWQY